jgi:hypothetical protein
MTRAQEVALQDLCQRYRVAYDPSHYFVHSPDDWMMAGYAEGWVGGMRHANSAYAVPEEPRRSPTIYVGVSPAGDVHS